MLACDSRAVDKDKGLQEKEDRNAQWKWSSTEESVEQYVFMDLHIDLHCPGSGS